MVEIRKHLLDCSPCSAVFAVPDCYYYSFFTHRENNYVLPFLFILVSFLIIFTYLDICSFILKSTVARIKYVCTTIISRANSNLGQNKCNIWTTPPPNFNDDKMARFYSFAPSSLLWGGGGERLIVPFLLMDVT